MSGSGPHPPDSTLPPFLLPYLSQLSALLDDLTLVEGFVLYPVELPSPDLARALASWLTTHHRLAHLVEPKSEDEFRQLGPTLLGMHPAPDDVVLVAFPAIQNVDELPPGLAEGLHLINQRRDALKQALGAPLLWCGPRPLLAAMAERAPDFWSIRDLGGKLRVPTEREVWRLPGTLGYGDQLKELDTDPEQLRGLYLAAKQQGDVRNAVRLALRLLPIYNYTRQFEDAEHLCDDALRGLSGSSDGDRRLRYLLLSSRATTWRESGRLEDARNLIETELIPYSRHVGNHGLLASAYFNLSDVFIASNEELQALPILIGKVLPFCEKAGDLHLLALTRLGIAQCLVKAGRNREAIELLNGQILPAFRQLQDPRSIAVAVHHLAHALQREGRLDESIELFYTTVLPTFKAIQDRHSLVVARVNLSDALLSRGRAGDRLDAHNALVQALREARRHHLPEADQIQRRLHHLDGQK